MATINEVKQFIESNFASEALANGLTKVVVTFDDGRSQLAFVSFDEISNQIFMSVESPFAQTGDVNPKLALEVAKTVPFGVGVLADYYTLKNVIPIADLDASEISFGIGFVTGQADSLETQILGTDKL